MICGKQIFTSRSEARNAISGANRDTRPGRGSKNRLASAYFCNDCNGWHVTSKVFRMKKVTKKEEVETVKKSNKKRNKGHGFLIIRNYTSKPI